MNIHPSDVAIETYFQRLHADYRRLRETSRDQQLALGKTAWRFLADLQLLFCLSEEQALKKFLGHMHGRNKAKMKAALRRARGGH